MPDQLPAGFPELLSFQCGVTSRGQALQSGMSLAAIRVRLRSGRWQHLYPGVYATFTGDPPRMALIWAALLSAGPGAAVSHHTAAELYQLGRRRVPALHVTVPAVRGLRRGPRPGSLPQVPPLIVHRSERIARTRHPVLEPPRTRIEETIIDLTQSADTFDEAFHWLCQGCASRLCTVTMLRAALAGRKKLCYRADLAAALGDVAAGVHSPLEYRYVRGVERAHSLPTAQRQVLVTLRGSNRYLDNLYQEYRVAVELDGAAAHPVAERWLDIHRDNSLASLGLVTLRYSWSDVTGRRCWVAAEIGAVLTQRGWPGTLRACRPGCPAAAP